MLYKLDESVGIVVGKLKEFFVPIQFYKSILNLNFLKRVLHFIKNLEVDLATVSASLDPID
jgi:hypothetical protein